MLKQLKQLASAYAKTADGSWLNDFGWQSVPVRFKALKNNVVGYHVLGKITLAESACVGLIFDIYIHELRHVWQFKKQPLRYLIGKLYRPLIEKDADAEEKKALDWYNGRKKMRDIEYIDYLRAEANVKRFSLPDDFRRTTSDKMVKLYNGIGAEWMPKWLRRLVTYICDRLEAPALVHDFEYSTNPKTFRRFTKANLRFAYNSAKCRRPILGIIGGIICQLFGWWAFKSGGDYEY